MSFASSVAQVWFVAAIQPGVTATCCSNCRDEVSSPRQDLISYQLMTCVTYPPFFPVMQVFFCLIAVERCGYGMAVEGSDGVMILRRAVIPSLPGKQAHPY